jgi:alcohol dehydrogenase
VPFADNSTYPVPDGASDEDTLMLADILPTGYEVGVPVTFELAVLLSRPGGRIANIGVHGKPATLHLKDQWTRDITITTGLVDAYSTPTLLRLLARHHIDASRFVTHHFALDEFDRAYDVFARPAETGALKVVLSRTV